MERGTVVQGTDSRSPEPGVTATLVTARTSDQLVHTGALFRPPAAARPVALLWVHGGGQNFYFPTYLRIGLAACGRGDAFLSVNTRGHDYNSKWDRFEAAPLDLAAWIDRLGELGYPQAILIGHSFGGWRVASYQAERRDTRVRGLVIASTPLRKREAWQTQLPRYQERLARASLPPGFPFETALLEGADHMYRGHEEEVAVTITRWADRLP